MHILSLSPLDTLELNDNNNNFEGVIVLGSCEHEITESFSLTYMLLVNWKPTGDCR